MWIYEKRLIYPLGDIRPNPRMAKLTAMLLGGPNGEFTAATTYLNQRYCMPCGAVQAILTDIGSEASEMEFSEALAFFSVSKAPVTPFATVKLHLCGSIFK